MLSPTKVKIAVPEVEFLGAIIGNQRIKLQPHIIKKIANFEEKELMTKHGLRSYIPNLGKLLSPLYAKVSPTGDKRLNTHD